MAFRQFARQVIAQSAEHINEQDYLSNAPSVKALGLSAKKRKLQPENRVGRLHYTLQRQLKVAAPPAVQDSNSSRALSKIRNEAILILVLVENDQIYES
jgi:hypothetical protein